MSVLNLSVEFSVRDGNHTFERVLDFVRRHSYRLGARRFYISGIEANPESELVLIQQDLLFASIRAGEEALAKTRQDLFEERFHVNRTRACVPFAQGLQVQDQGKELEYYLGLSTFSLAGEQSEQLIGFCQAVGLILLYEPRNLRAYFDQYVWRVSMDLGLQHFQAQAAWNSYLAELLALGAKNLTGNEIWYVIKDDDPEQEDLAIRRKMQTSR